MASKKLNLVKDLKDAKKLFDALNVPWAVYAGAAASVYGCDREIRDVDILVPKKYNKKVSSAFKANFEERLFKYYTCKVQVRIVRIEKIEIAMEPRVSVDTGSYIFSFDSIMIRRRKQARLFNLKVPVISVEDNIAFKCLLQRGVKDNKHDLQDARHMLFRNRIDFGYLTDRINVIGARGRILSALQKVLFE